MSKINEIFDELWYNEEVGQVARYTAREQFQAQLRSLVDEVIIGFDYPIVGNIPETERISRIGANTEKQIARQRADELFGRKEQS